MNVKFNDFLIGKFILVVYVVCVYLFASGFLFQKTVITTRSTPDDYNDIPSWHSSRFEKVLFFLVDALRFDMMIPTITGEMHMNAFSVLNKSLEDVPEKSYLSMFIADPPTSTTQRVKALSSGSMPTFAEIAKNFGDDSVVEDNIIFHMNSRNMKVSLLGDDVWLSLYDGLISRSGVGNSFNVWDLYSVDNVILDNYMDEILGKRGDWTLLILHFLGVDHAGHRFHLRSEELRERLLTYDSTLRKVIENAPEDTLILLFGDHGMIESGDHGGGTVQEITSGLFALSHGRSITSSSPSIRHFLKLFGNDENIEYHSIPQVDLAPTISYLLGLPIPFVNIGRIIPEFAFALADDDYAAECSLSSNCSHESMYCYKLDPVAFSESVMSNLLSVEELDFRVRNLREIIQSGQEILANGSILEQNEMRKGLLNLQRAWRYNVRQVIRLLSFYNSTSSFSDVDILRSLEVNAEVLFKSYCKQNDTVSLICSTVLLNQCLLLARKLCVLQWGEYDVFKMYSNVWAACLLFFVYLAFLFGLFHIGTAVPIISLLLFSLIGIFAVYLFPGYLCGALVVISLVCLGTMYRRILDALKILYRVMCNLFIYGFSRIVVCLLVLATNLYTQHSDCFIVSEDRVITVLVIVLVLSQAHELVKVSVRRLEWRPWLAISAQIIATRISCSGMISRVIDRVDKNILSSSMIELCLSFAVIILMLYLSAKVSRMFSSYGIWMVQVSVGLVFLHWSSESFNGDANLFLFHIVVPRIVFLISFLGSVIFRTPGIGRAFFFFPSMMLLSGPNNAKIFAVVLVHVMSFIYVEYILTEAKLRFVSVRKGIVNGSIHLVPAVVTIRQLSSLYFFATGHQCTFNSVDWNAAFTGFEKYHPFFSSIPMILNEWSSTFLFTLVLMSLGQLLLQKRAIPEHDKALKALYVLLYMAVLCSSMMSLYERRRNLMVWEVYAPKFCFECSFFCLVVALFLVHDLKSICTNNNK